MQGNKLLKIAVSTIAIASLLVGIFVVAFPVEAGGDVYPWDFPRLDKIYMIEAYPRATAVQKCKDAVIDCFLGATVVADINTLRGSPYYWNISWVDGFHWCYHGFNTQDHPDHAGEEVWFYNRTNDFELYPLNISAFRLSLGYIVGTLKEPWISEIYGYICVPQYWFVPYANAYYVNPYLVPYEHSWATAEQILLDAGFTHLAGPDLKFNAEDDLSTDDKWLMPNGAVLYDGTGGSGGNGYSERYAGSDAQSLNVYGIFVAAPGDLIAPTTRECSRRHVRQWNKFFMGVASDGVPDHTNTALFIELPDNTANYYYYSPRYNHDFDMFMLCFGFGNTPDYLYDLFHPNTYFPGSGNVFGHENEYCNKIEWAIKFWKLIDWDYLEYNVGDYPEGKVLPACTNFALPQTTNIAGVYVVRCTTGGVYKELLVSPTDYTITGSTLHLEKAITLMPGELLVIEYTGRTYHRQMTTEEEMRNLVWLIQWLLFYEAPAETVYTRNYYDLYESGRNEGGNPGPPFEGWVLMPGFGSGTYAVLMPWTFANIHRQGTLVGGTMDWQCAGEVYTLNPITVAWVYEVMITNRIFESGRVLHPYTHATLPWIATDFKIIPWVDPEQGVDNGMIIKIWLRQDVYWQDGSHVTAKDVKWNFDFINSTQCGELVGLWEYYLGCDVVNEYLAEIFVNSTGLWRAYDYLDAIVAFPKIVWFPFWGDYTAATEFKPWAVRYDTWTGCAAPVWTDRNGDGIGDLTCLFGTGPFILDYWNEITTALLYKNPIYWVRQAAMPSGYLFTPRLKTQGAMKIITGPTFELESAMLPRQNPPYPDYPKEPMIDPHFPICSWWIVTQMGPTAWAHIDSWVDDNQDGVLSPSDNIDMLVNWPNGMRGILNFHVDAIIWDQGAGKWRMIISQATIIPVETELPEIYVMNLAVTGEDPICEYYITATNTTGTYPIIGTAGSPVKIDAASFGTYPCKLVLYSKQNLSPDTYTIKIYQRNQGGAYGAPVTFTVNFGTYQKWHMGADVTGPGPRPEIPTAKDNSVDFNDDRFFGWAYTDYGKNGYVKPGYYICDFYNDEKIDFNDDRFFGWAYIKFGQVGVDP